MRLGFAIAVHVRRGHPAARRGVRGRRRGVPAQVHREDPRLQGARRDRLLRLALGACGRAALRARDPAGARARSSTTAPASEAITRYHAVARARGESRGGRRGPARVGERRGSRRDGAAARGADGEPRAHFVSGEPVDDRAAARGRACPSTLRCCRSRCATADGSLLGADRQDRRRARLGRRAGERELRFLLEKLPLGEGEFQISVALDRCRGDPAVPPGRRARCASTSSRRTTLAGPCCSTASGGWPRRGTKVEAG